MELHWMWLVLIFVISFSIKDIVRKSTLNHYDNYAVLGLEFIFTWLVIAAAVLFFRVSLDLSLYSLTFLSLGFLHALGTMGKVNAMNISLSRTQLVSKYTVLFPMVLAVIFLGEFEYLHLNSVSGLLRVTALLLLPFSLYFLQDKKKVSGKVGGVWLLSVIQFFIFHAGLDVLIKLNIRPEMILQAAFFQRLGSALLVNVVALFTKTRFPFEFRLWGVSALNGVLISIAYLATITALSVAPIVLLKPIQKMATTVLITLVGLYIFNERKSINRFSRWGYVLSAVGAVLIVVAEILAHL